MKWNEHANADSVCLRGGGGFLALLGAEKGVRADDQNNQGFYLINLTTGQPPRIGTFDEAVIDIAIPLNQ